MLVSLFGARFDPDREGEEVADLRERIAAALDAVPSLEEDRILRSFLSLIEATLRTNAYLENRQALAFKFRSADVPDVPLPHPVAEIFVISNEVEGIHLRGGPVARGGIRWSTRREDYRTEVLGLMKAQMTKNAVIVPTGAKGGFVLRRAPDAPEELRAEVKHQYEIFVGALLDVTDNLVGGEVVKPPEVRVHDGDDPYLVVAADKGTATFSDAANRLAMDRNFWLGDAFASGGSSGYDHKALGITARGAWQSLARHFRELDIDPTKDPFTVVGIGDMSGDVFGNGMLGSDRIRLVAAFDHRHVFIDPYPDPAASFAERRRLFELKRSSWDDYDGSLISDGGGVYSRSDKKVVLSPQAQEALGTDRQAVTPAGLIRIILAAPVDMLWNGGIGTYVKASTETHAEVGDRTNDPVRVDAVDLRCRVVVEGGNLGLTQAGRVEFALGGGRVNADFIDNSGGVDCSDREVNLKILLGMAERAGLLARSERDRLIEEVADDVVERILYDNFQQAQMISQEMDASVRRMSGYEELMANLESAGLLDRAVEGLPGSDEMIERARLRRGLTRPELSVLLAYAKRSTEQALMVSDLPDDPYLLVDMERYFPARVVERFGDLLAEHPLRRELVATMLANDVVNSQGVLFVSRLGEQTGASAHEIVAAYRVARDVSNAVENWEAIEGLFSSVSVERASTLMRTADRAVAALAHWYLGRTGSASIGELVERHRPGLAEIERVALDIGPESWQTNRAEFVARLEGEGVPPALAHRHGALPVVVYGPDVIEVAEDHGLGVAATLDVFLQVGRSFGLDRLTDLARAIQLDNRWQRWALWTVEEELLVVRRRAAERVLDLAEGRTGADAVEHFRKSRPSHTTRLSRFLDVFDFEGDRDVAPLMVALRQVRSALT
jgi:glutamate dehydrogenase